MIAYLPISRSWVCTRCQDRSMYWVVGPTEDRLHNENLLQIIKPSDWDFSSWWIGKKWIEYSVRKNIEHESKLNCTEARMKSAFLF